MTKTYYAGLDVHKETITIAYATGGTREDSVYHGPCGGSVLAAERALRNSPKNSVSNSPPSRSATKQVPPGSFSPAD